MLFYGGKKCRSIVNKLIIWFCCSSGVKFIEKREGSGFYNWGLFKDDM